MYEEIVLKNYLELNKRLNATEQKFKSSCKVIADKFAAVKNGTSSELPTVEEISQIKKAWQELLEIGQAMNKLHWN
jgi:hypothetical protein